MHNGPAHVKDAAFCDLPHAGGSVSKACCLGRRLDWHGEVR